MRERSAPRAQHIHIHIYTYTETRTYVYTRVRGEARGRREYWRNGGKKRISRYSSVTVDRSRRELFSCCAEKKGVRLRVEEAGMVAVHPTKELPSPCRWRGCRSRPNASKEGRRGRSGSGHRPSPRSAGERLTPGYRYGRRWVTEGGGGGDGVAASPLPGARHGCRWCVWCGFGEGAGNDSGVTTTTTSRISRGRITAWSAPNASNMPRCLMAKKWKAYPWPDRVDDPQQEEENDPSSVLQEGHGGVQQTAASLEKRQHRHEPVEDEEIDVVGDTDTRQVDHQQTCWGPHSPTAGATAPSPPPLNASGALYYHGEYHAPSLSSFGINFAGRIRADKIFHVFPLLLFTSPCHALHSHARIPWILISYHGKRERDRVSWSLAMRRGWHTRRSVMRYREIAVLVRGTRGGSPHGTPLSEKYIVWTTTALLLLLLLLCPPLSSSI